MMSLKIRNKIFYVRFGITDVVPNKDNIGTKRTYTWNDLDILRNQGYSWREIGEIYGLKHQGLNRFWQINKPN